MMDLKFDEDVARLQKHKGFKTLHQMLKLNFHLFPPLLTVAFENAIGEAKNSFLSNLTLLDIFLTFSCHCVARKRSEMMVWFVFSKSLQTPLVPLHLLLVH